MTHGCLGRRMFTGTATSVRCLIARRWRILRGRLIDLVMLIDLTSAPLLKERELYGDASDLAMDESNSDHIRFHIGNFRLVETKRNVHA